MSRKWRSSKTVTVDGSAFKQARRSFIGKDEDIRRGEYGYGSQEWLAEQAKLSPRTVNSLETGKATVKTVDAVSRVLNIKGRKYIRGYGEETTTLRASGVIDFRPCINGRLTGNESVYLDEAFLITLLPLMIMIDDNFIDEVVLKNIKLKLSFGGLEIDFSWVYNVNLNSRATTWLGDEEEVSDVVIYTKKPYQNSIMFKQDSIYPISWGDFITHIERTDDVRILININLESEHFNKNDYVLISIEEVKNLLKISYPKGYPYWIEPKALMR